jgi:hypothetical protein
MIATRLLPLLCAAALAVAAAGCASISGTVMRDVREEFNDTAQITNAEQLLRNIVRLRYANSPYFLEISSVSTSATMAGSLNVFANTAPAAAGLGTNALINPGVSYSQTPSFVFQPLTGEKLARQLLRPVDMRTLALLRTAGWDLREVMLTLVDSINGVANAPAATQFAPTVLADNLEFRRVVEILDTLEEKGLLLLGLDAGASPQDARGDIVLSLQIDRAAASRADVQELIRKLALDPSNLTYRIAAAASGGGGRNIAVRPRSILAAMRFVSKGIDVPERDLRSGFVPALTDGPGLVSEWSGLLKDIMRIRSSPSSPESAYVRVQYRDNWFYIDNADLASKQTFALLETAIALQAGDVPPISTVLTLPISR